ncbi:hypothetical protein [Pseudalkalibacillus sp. SCS-8]
MKVWSFIAFVLLGFSFGLYIDNPFPGILGGIGIGLLSVITLKYIDQQKT